MGCGIEVPRYLGRTARRTSLRLLSVRQAAEYAGVSTSTVRRWVKSGSLKIYRAGRQIRIDESDLIDYISSQEGKLL